MRKLSTITIQSAATTLRVKHLRLEVQDGPNRGQVYTGQQESITVGSAPGNDLALDDAAVSRHHFEIMVLPDGFLLRDLDSTNGTRVEGLRVREIYLRSGVHIEAGNSRLRFEALSQESELELASQQTFGGLLGVSAAMRRVFAILEKVCQRDSTVLITGESGTGKELVARALHEQSPRQKNPFVVVDCGAMPMGLMESEIFGHERGAFTGAVNARPGALERADGGTLMLDEIGELPLELQPKLLRVLESREVTRLGGTQSRKVNVRLVAATNRDLRAEVNRQAFRGDLYFRLSVVEIRLPPLRERVEDIPHLVQHFLRLLSERAGDQLDYELAPEAAEYLLRHKWPGNVRELRNFIERSISLADGRVLWTDAAELLQAIGAAGSSQIETPPSLTDPPASQAPADGPMGGLEALEKLPFVTARRVCNEQFERYYLGALLRRNGGVVARAAREAQMDRTHLNELLKKHDLK